MLYFSNYKYCTALIFSIIIGFFMSSCSNEKKLPDQKLPEYSVNVNLKDGLELDLERLLQGSQWIPLKNENIDGAAEADFGTDFFLIGNESIYNDYINIISFNFSGKSQFVFDNSNHFLPSVENIDDFRIIGDTLMILHRISGKIIYFGSAGNYLGVDIDVPIGNAFLPISNEQIVFYSGTKNYHPISKITGHFFYTYDTKKKKVIHSFAPYPPAFQDSGLSIVATPIFRGENKNLALCTISTNDTIYEASSSDYTAKYFVDFPNNQKKSAVLDKLNRKVLEYEKTNRNMDEVDSEALDLIMNPDFVRAIDFVHEYEEYLLLVFSFGTKKRYLSLYNKTNNQTITLRMNALSNTYQNRFFQGADNNYIYFISSDPETLFEKEPNLSLPEGHIPQAGDEANPIVFKINLEALINSIENIQQK